MDLSVIHTQPPIPRTTFHDWGLEIRNNPARLGPDIRGVMDMVVGGSDMFLVTLRRCNIEPYGRRSRGGPGGADDKMPRRSRKVRLGR